jgi:hypothetical protein
MGVVAVRQRVLVSEVVLVADRWEVAALGALHRLGAHALEDADVRPIDFHI